MGVRKQVPFIAALLLAPQIAEAGGIFVPGAGPVGQSRAGAFTAKADDPSTLAYNPAGFAKIDGTQLYIGGNFIRMLMHYTRSGVYEPTNNPDGEPAYVGDPFPTVKNNPYDATGLFGFATIPTLALSTDLGMPDSPFRFGIGIHTEQGFPSRSYELEVTTENGNRAPAPQRYDVVTQDVILASPSLVVAYSPLDNLDFGLRASWGIARMNGQKAVWTLRNYEEDPSNDSTFELREAKDNFVPTVGLGMLYRPSDNWEIGAAYNSKGNMYAKGSGSSEVGNGPLGDGVMVIPRPDEFAECGTYGEPGDLAACVDINLAQNASLAGRYIMRDPQGREKGDIELDLRWEDWSASNDVTVQVDGQVNVTGGFLYSIKNPHGFRDVLSTRLGSSYNFYLGEGVLSWKGGLAYDTAAAPDSFIRADQDGKERVTMATGLSYDTGKYRFDLGIGAVWEPDVTVDACKPPTGPTVDDPGCAAGGGENSVEDRNQPSPTQPLFPDNAQRESPFNAGLYESGYLMGSFGVMVRF